MLTYNMDVEKNSLWLRATPGSGALDQPYYCTEVGLFYGRGHFATARTDKDSYLLFYTLAGAGLVEQGENRLELPEGSALLLNCRTPQSYCTAPGQSRWHHYWAHIDGAGVRALEPVLNPSRTAGAASLTPVRLPAGNAVKAFEAIIRGFEDQTTENLIRTGMAIHQLLAEMAQVRLGAGDAVAKSNRELVHAAIDHIRTHYAQPLSLDDLLANAGISKSYFLRIFRQYAGTTPYNYLVRYRITQAKGLLVLTDLPVREIARKVGFSEETNFSVRFASIVGQSPQQYRKSIVKK